jgi:hypothetical protein
MPNVRDDRDTSLLRAGMAQRKSLVWGLKEANYFSRHDWTTQITLKRLDKSDFTRTRFAPHRATPDKPKPAQFT